MYLPKRNHKYNTIQCFSNTTINRNLYFLPHKQTQVNEAKLMVFIHFSYTPVLLPFWFSSVTSFQIPNCNAFSKNSYFYHIPANICISTHKPCLSHPLLIFNYVQQTIRHKTFYSTTYLQQLIPLGLNIILLGI